MATVTLRNGHVINKQHAENIFLCLQCLEKQKVWLFGTLQ